MVERAKQACFCRSHASSHAKMVFDSPVFAQLPPDHADLRALQAELYALRADLFAMRAESWRNVSSDCSTGADRQTSHARV